MVAAERRWSVAGALSAALTLLRELVRPQELRSALARVPKSKVALPQVLGLRLDQWASVLVLVGRMAYHRLVVAMMLR